MRSKSNHPGIILGVLLLACTPDRTDPQSQTLRSPCEHICAAITCDGVTDIDETDLEDCTHACLDRHTATADISPACADAYARLINCVSESSCEEIVDWGHDPETSTVCAMPGEELAETCPQFELSFGG